MSNQTIFEPGAPAKRSGCGGPCLKSCLGVTIVLAVLVVIGVVVLYTAVGRLADRYLDTEPMDLPTVTLPPQEQLALEERIAAFEAAFDTPGEVATLRLSDREINAYIQNLPEGSEIAEFGKFFYVTIEDGTIRGDMSLPLSEVMPIGILSDRYLNGSATLRVDIVNGSLELYAENIELKNEDLPDYFLNEFRGQNLLEELKNDPDFQRFQQSIDTFRIEGNEIILVLQNMLDEQEATDYIEDESY
jgi:hypothetical protein